MNSYKYRKSNIALDKRLKEIVGRLNREFKNGSIQTETDYVYKMKDAVVSFYKTVGKPTFTFHPASDVPSFTHYVDMVTKAKADMDVLLEGCISISNNLKVSESELNDTVNVLVKRTNNILANVMNLEKKIKSLRNIKNVIYSDSFNTNTNTHRETSEEFSAYADTSSGTLMLPHTSNKRIVDEFETKILDTSNGFPGNTHEVYYSNVVSANNNVRFKGENDPHLSLKSLTENGVKNTWFEFEIFKLSEEIEVATSGIGFMYKEGVRWVTDDNSLILDLELYTENPVKGNYIKITGTPKSNSNVSNPVIKKITISDDITGVQVIHINKELIDDIVVTFTSQYIRKVKIEIEQKEGILTDVCRQFALNVDPVKIPYLAIDEFRDYMQIEKPSYSIELLGLKYDQSNSTIIYPSTKDKNNFLSEEYVKSKLFYSNKSESNYKIKTEVVKATRYSIGLKDIDIRDKKYLDSSVYISEDFISNEPIKTITFNAEDYIPGKFKNFIKKEEDINKFIEYFISFDNGATWIKINPRHKAHIGPCTIVINSNAVVSNRNKNISYIDLITEPNEFKIKIEISRPKEIEDETPIIYGYFVDVSSEEDL